MTLRTGGRGGPLEKKITVFSNDPENPQFQLTIGCEISVDVAVEPRQLVFGQIGKGETAEQGFQVTVNEPETIKITGVTVEDERFQVKLAEGTPEGSGKYLLKFTGDKGVGRVVTSVKIRYEGSSVPEVAVPVRAEIVGDLVYAKSLYFNKKDDAFPERTIEFTSRAGKAVKLPKVEDPDKQLTHEVRYESGGKKAVLTVRVADPAASYDKPARHKLLVHTSDPDEPVVEIPYTISERGRGAMLPGTRGARQKPMGPPRMPLEEAFKKKDAEEKAAKAAKSEER